MSEFGLKEKNPVLLSPSTILSLARDPKTLISVQEILRQLEPDEFVNYTQDYYKSGQEKYGDHWLYADQLTVLFASTQLIDVKNYLEIGVFRGRSLSVVANSANNANLFGFDLWVDQYAGLSNPGAEYVYKQLDRVGFNGKATFISGDSKITLPEFLENNPGLMFDLITVDGDHREEGARIDLDNVLPRLRLGGVLVFDDISHPLHLGLEKVWKEVVGINPDFVTATYSEVGNGIAVAVRKDSGEYFDTLKGSYDDKLEILAKSYKAAQADLLVMEKNFQILNRKFKETQHDQTNQIQVIQNLEQRLAEVDKDRSARLEIIHKLDGQLKEAEEDRSDRLKIIHRLEKRLEEAEEDRSARLEVIHNLQNQQIQDLQNRIKVVSDLEAKIQELETGHNSDKEIIGDLEGKLRKSESDRNAQRNEIRELELELEEIQEELDEKMGYINTLEERNSKLLRENELSLKIKQTLNENIHRQAYYLADYEHQLSRFPIKIINKIQKKMVGGIEKLTQLISARWKKRRSNEIKRMLIDLTPILPGGSNGGAKPMTTALIWHFSRNIAPECEYILLTSDDAHEELSWLDASNVQRICVNYRSRLERDTSSENERNNLPISIPEDTTELGENNNKEDNQLDEFGVERLTKKESRPIIPALIHFMGATLEWILPRSTYLKIYKLYKRDLSTPGVRKSILNLDVDLLFCPFTAPFYYDGKTPAVIVVHDLQFIAYPQFFLDDLIFQTDQNFRDSCKVASRLICISDHTRKMLIDTYEINPDKVKIIPHSLCNPVKAVPVNTAKKVLRTFNLKASEYLLYPANFWQHKNHEMLITAFAMFKQENADSKLKLVFTGNPGSRMSYLEDIVGRMGLSDQIIFAGFLEVETFSALLQSCLAMVFPSLYEGFGIPVLEAMTLGVPVLCSNFTSLPEVGGSAVHYFDPRKPEEIKTSIEIISRDDVYRNQLIDKGFKRSKEFVEPIQWAKEYFQVFKEVVGEERNYAAGIFGVSPDHWAGDNFEITIPAGDSKRFFELSLRVPEWFPYDRISGSLTLGGKRPQKFRIERGQRRIFGAKISSSSMMVNVKFKDSVRPKDMGIGEDSRSLCCQVLWCRLITSEGVISIYEAGLE